MLDAIFFCFFLRFRSSWNFESGSCTTIARRLGVYLVEPHFCDGSFRHGVGKGHGAWHDHLGVERLYRRIVSLLWRAEFFIKNFGYKGSGESRQIFQ